MTRGKPSTPIEPNDPGDDRGDEAFAGDDALRAESAWLLAREHDPEAPPPSAEIASDYAEIEDLLRNLPMGATDEAWHDEVLRAATRAPSRRPWWRRAAAGWLITGGAVLAAAVVILLLLPARPDAELEIATHPGIAARAAPDEVVVGDHLAVIARPRGAADLRVFRSDGTPVAGCPHGPRCRVLAEGGYAIDATLDAPVPYHVILVVGTIGALPDATMDAYMFAARTAQARIVTPPPIDVH